MINSTLDVLFAGLHAILAYRSLSRSRRPSSGSRSTEDLNTYGLPEGDSIEKELVRWYRRQRKEILQYIPHASEILPVVLPVQFPSLTSQAWVDPMARSMVPRLAPIWDDSYRSVQAHLARNRAVAEGVVNPHLRFVIEHQAFAFCRSTNESTSRRLDEALNDLKRELVEGLVEKGDSIPELRDRVNSIFDSLTRQHAETIARTEAARAVHQAQILAAQESGIVAGFEWLISADACDLCQKVATECKRVRIDQAFAVVGDHSLYSTIMAPPLHPNCRCSLLEILKPEYGGPTDVDWGETLIQPQKTIVHGYTPPPGKHVPEPEPERIISHEAKAIPGPVDALTIEIGLEAKKALSRAANIAMENGIRVNRNGYNVIAKVFGDRAATTHAAYASQTKTIYLNERSPYWSNQEEFHNKWSNAGWFSSTDQDHIINHEIGHALHDMGSHTHYEGLRGKEFNDDQKVKIKADVSRYASSSPLELVAEMYAGLKAGKVYDDSLMKLYYEKLKGPRV